MSDDLREILESCPLLRTTTCNVSELAWIAKARRALVGTSAPVQAAKPMFPFTVADIPARFTATEAAAKYRTLADGERAVMRTILTIRDRLAREMLMEWRPDLLPLIEASEVGPIRAIMEADHVTLTHVWPIGYVPPMDGSEPASKLVLERRRPGKAPEVIASRPCP